MTPAQKHNADGFSADVALAILLVRSPIRHYAGGVAWRPPEQPGTVRYATTADVIALGRQAVESPRAAHHYTDWLSEFDPPSCSADDMVEQYGMETCASLEDLRLSARWDRDPVAIAAVDLLATEIAAAVKARAS